MLHAYDLYFLSLALVIFLDVWVHITLFFEICWSYVVTLLWSFVITCTSLFFGDDMVAPLSFFFVGYGEHGRVVETG